MSHDLLLILEEAIQLSGNAEELRDPLSLLMPYSVEIRYPDDGAELSFEDAREARDAAEIVLAWLKRAIPDLFPSASSNHS